MKSEDEIRIEYKRLDALVNELPTDSEKGKQAYAARQSFAWIYGMRSPYDMLTDAPIKEGSSGAIPV